MSRTITTFADVLRHLRTVASLSQEDLAERAGLSLRGVSDLERGVRRTPHLITVRMLADALELSPPDRQALLAAARPETLPDSDAGPFARGPLPTPLTALIGREQELADLIALLGQANVRLVTLTGPGGTGKTRLALEVGAHLQGTFNDGVVFVDLAPVREAQFVLPTLATTLGVGERTGQPLRETLARVLAPKQLLLLLDNCEQVLAAAPEIAALLAACPHLSVLATSRAALRVRGEREVPLLPLPLPASDRRSSVADVALVPAVALFLERATASAPRFALTSDNAAAVAAICRRLDGLPLAIELAAAWIRVLPPAALLDRLEQRLLLLTGGSRDLPARQQTMRDAIAWSYDLLAESEQTLFRRLAVFVGGWTLDAAEEVSCGSDRLDVLGGLDALITASLVQTVEHPDGERRFGMLETVREFGMEQLTRRGEADEVGRRHADYFLALAEAGGAALGGAAPGEWVARLEAEQANIRAALSWLRDREESAAGLRLAAALGGFWRLRSANTEGRAWLETFLAQDGATEASSEESSTDRIAALRWAGEIAGLLGDPATADARLSESLSLARERGDKRGVASALGAIGSALFQHVDVASSIAPFTEAVDLSRELGDVRQTAFLQAFLGGAIAHQGDLARGDALVAESAEMLRALGDTRSFEANFVTLVQGWMAFVGEDYHRAEDRLNAALVLGQVIDAKAILSATQALFGEVAQARGHAEVAAGHFREGLFQGWEGDYPLGIAWNLHGLVRLGSHGGALTAVARLVGVLDAFPGPMQALPPAAVAAHEVDVTRVRTVLGEEVFSAARKAGQALSLEESIVEALALADTLMGVPT
jgi:predicted ATPase/DNA-binding XRE family transcriptional regulator